MKKTDKMIGRLKCRITEEEIRIADRSIDMALEAGASAVQVTLDKARTELYALLDGEIDNIRQTGDRALTFRLHADGRYGVFSTNRLEENSLRQFLRQAVANVRLLAPDRFRRLPDAGECATDAIRGDETGLCWYGYDSVRKKDQLEMARRVSVFREYDGGNAPDLRSHDRKFHSGFGKASDGSSQSADEDGGRRGVEDDNHEREEDGSLPETVREEVWHTSPNGHKWRLISEEVEYSNAMTDTYLTNSDRIRCRQTETSFEVCSQVTVEDTDGNKYSGMWWDYGISPDRLISSDCGHKAIMQAVKHIAPINIDSGKYVMVVSCRVSGKLLQPILNALSGRAIQQKSSFLTDTLGQKIFSEGMTVIDLPREVGKCGAIFFESDGRIAQNREIITGGVVKEYFINTYISGKLDMPATSECANRPVLKPWLSPELAEGHIVCEQGGGDCSRQQAALAVDLPKGLADNVQSDGIGGKSLPWAGQTGRRESLSGMHIGETEIMQLCGRGILVTDFNGGNCNATTGDFSYGVMGLLFENGKVTRPISNMLITGNMISLWNNLIAAGSDPVDGMSRQVPTLAFKDVDFTS